MNVFGRAGFNLWLGGLFTMFAVMPSSTTYTLKSYDIGSGGTGNSTSTSYKLNGVSGNQTGTSTQTSTTYVLGDGINNAINSNVPLAPTFTNPSNYYDRLRVIISNGSNPTDTKFLIAISSDNFVTTQYVQSDNSIGTSQAIANYQTYAAWGSGSGFLVTGLQPSTTYKIKVKALQGNFSGSAFGPTATASTVAPSLTFSLTTTLTGSPPFAVGFAGITPNTVQSGDADALISITSNANNGGAVYIKDSNAGLTSSSTSTTVASATADLSSAPSGYGAQVTAVGQAAGGPMVSQSPYNGASNNVGGLLAALQPIISTNGPVTTGTGTIRFKAKVTNITPSATDYADIVTVIVAMNY